MVKVLQAAPNPGKPQKQRPANIPSVSQITGQQIDQLLGVVNCIFPYVMQSHAGPGETPQSVMKEAADSAETTFMNACSALDSILQDKKRWSAETYDSLEASLKEVYAANVKVAEASENALIQQQRPSFLLKPMLTQKKDGIWEARFGKGEESLAGFGATPQEAYIAFDMAYYGLMAEVEEQKSKKKK